MLPVDQMKALMDEIISLGNELRQFHGCDNTPARPRPAATSAALSTFRNRFGNLVSPSYQQLLSIYDGIDNFEWVDVSIHSTDFLLTHNNLDEFWVDIDAFARGELFIFAQSKSDAHVVAFLTHNVGAEGELAVIHLDAKGPLGEYENLEAYIQSRRDWFAGALADEKADRARLSDDD